MYKKFIKVSKFCSKSINSKIVHFKVCNFTDCSNIFKKQQHFLKTKFSILHIIHKIRMCIGLKSKS